MKQRALKEWLSGINGVSSVDCLLTDIASDSRQLRPGVAFLAYPGDQYDGRDFIADAIKRGAAAIIYESPYDLPVDYQNTEMLLLACLICHSVEQSWLLDSMITRPKNYLL